jgi:nucleotide-binding universal stress UspA family protein
MDHPIESPLRIVVGVDGSPCSKRALGWAVHEAYLAGATVEAIASWQDPTMSGYGFGWMPPVSGESQDWAVVTDTYLKEAVTEAVSHHGEQVEVVSRVVEGHPAQVLLDAAVGAQLLVVGSRGHGTLAGMLLGSVSQHCVQHAPCPVVVVPLGEAAAPASRS